MLPLTIGLDLKTMVPLVIGLGVPTVKEALLIVTGGRDTAVTLANEEVNAMSLPIIPVIPRLLGNRVRGGEDRHSHDLGIHSHSHITREGRVGV